MVPTFWKPRGYSRLGLLRRWWHIRVLHHHVAGSIVKDVKTLNKRQFEFIYRRGWVCVNCRALWP